MIIYKSKKILLISTILLGLTVVAGVILLSFIGSEKKEDKIRDVSVNLIEDGPCSARVPESILSRSVNLFLSSENPEQALDSEVPRKQFEVEQEIITLTDYERDANCLHILSMIYINRSDLQASEKHLQLLTQGLESTNPKSYILDENANFMSLEDMKLAVENIRLFEQQVKENDPFKDQNRIDERTL